MRKTPNADRASAALFAALGDETRLSLVRRLGHDGPMSMVRLTAGATLTRQAIAKHLRVMQAAGLVLCAKHGRESIWRLDQRRLARTQRYLDTISKQWDAAIGRLQAFVED